MLSQAFSHRLLTAAFATLFSGCALTVENDVGGFGGNSDRNYTNGLRAQYSTRLDKAPGWTRPWAVPIVEAIDFFAPATPPPGMHHQPAFSLAVGQTMYSPQDLTRSDVIRDDRPYGGWLYVGLARSDLVLDDDQRRRDYETTLGFDLGVTGRPSLAEDTQIWFHRLIDSTSPKGWDNQIGFEPGVILKLAHKRRLLYLQAFPVIPQLDIVTRLGASAGNISSHGSIGLLARAGWNLPRDFGSDLAEKIGVLPDNLPTKGPSIHGFVGADGRAALRDIFLDGNTWRSSHSVSKEIFVADLKAGVAIQWGRLRLSYTYYFRTREFKRQDTPHAFGSITLGWTRTLQ
jgi:hypothetical protein